MAIISISDSQVNSADQILVADSNSKIPAKDGSQITILNATNVASGTIASARLDTGTTAGKLVVLDGSGNLPAVNASLLTGIVSATISASDPTISTNPSGGVGTEWLNSTSGEMYICTDATAGENVWKNVGAGSDNVQPWYFGGTQYGYSYGGTSNSNINQWSLTSDGNATDVGDQSVERRNTGGASSATYGYNFGGWPSDVIDKFPFAAAAGFTMTDVGNLLATLRYMSAHSTVDYGWSAGGAAPTVNIVQKFAFATDGNSTDWSDLVIATTSCSAGAQSETYGYLSGGYISGESNMIQKFPFATQTTGTDVGNLTINVISTGSASSGTHGYSMGGNMVPPSAPSSTSTNHIEKFSFATDGNATDVANLIQPMYRPHSASSRTHGYKAGGALDGGSPKYNIIEKFAFATDSDATDVGDLTQTDEFNGHGSQY